MDIQNLSRWLGESGLADLASVFGFCVSVLGFAFTLNAVFKSRSAAMRAEAAAKETKEAISFMDTVSDYATAEAIMEEIRRHQRNEDWTALPERYSAVRKILIRIKSAHPNIGEQKTSLLQKVIVQLADAEKSIEISSNSDRRPRNAAKMAAAMLEHLDQIREMLAQLRAEGAEQK